MFDSHVDRLKASQLRAWEAMKEIADRVNSSGEMTAEDRESYDRAEADYDGLRTEIDRLTKATAYQRPEWDDAVRGAARPAEQRVDDDNAIVRRLATGDLRSFTFERRDVTKSSTGAPVPTSFYDTLIEHLRYTGPMMDASVVQIMRTTSGETIQVPRTSAWSNATATAEGALFAESDPSFLAFVNLRAWKYGTLFQVSREMITDSGVNLLDYIGRQAGYAIGTAVNYALTVGTGTVQPNGIVTAASSGVTGATSVTGAFTGDNLIDLRYSVDTAYTRAPGAGWMMNRTALAAVRKLKENGTSGAYLFEPSLVAGQPDRLLGFPVFENPDVASPGTAVKSVIFGNLQQFMVRMAGGIEVARSDEFAFNADLVTFRATVRVDSDLPQTGAIKYFIGGAS